MNSVNDIPSLDSLLNLFFNHLEKNNYLKNNRIFFDLWNWTIKNPDIFWSEFWNFSKIIGDKGKRVIDKDKIFNKSKFFSDSKVNYTENILKKRSNDVAINFFSETGFEEKISWNSLYEKVCKFSSFYLLLITKER